MDHFLITIIFHFQKSALVLLLAIDNIEVNSKFHLRTHSCNHVEEVFPIATSYAVENTGANGTHM